MNTTIQKWYTDHYGPTTNKLDFNLLHIILLGKHCCVETGQKNVEISNRIMDTKICRGYYEHIYFQFCNKPEQQVILQRGMTLDHFQFQSNNISENLISEDIINHVLYLCLTTVINIMPLQVHILKW